MRSGGRSGQCEGVSERGMEDGANATMHCGYMHVQVALLVGAVRATRTHVRLFTRVNECVSAQELPLVLPAEHLTTNMTVETAGPAWGHPTHL